MTRLSTPAILFACALTLTGCAGKDFVRPADGQFVTGKSTINDVTAKMGEPYQKGEVTKNEKMLSVYRYAYANTGGKPAYEGVTPARGMNFAFNNGTLVAQEFMSSFSEDSSDFDETKVPQIVKGKSTRQDVIALFGKPGGDGIYPYIKGVNDKAVVYNYNHVKGSVFDMKFYAKALIVSFDNAGIVSDVEYSLSGTK